MTNSYLFDRILLLLFITSFMSSCKGQSNSNVDSIDNKEQLQKKMNSQIGQYVTGTFEDSKGHLWFGTIEKGIAKYDGNKLKYYTKKDGLPSNRVTGLIEDSKGVFWLKTDEGLSRFDGKTFTNFPVNKNDFNSNLISQLLIDSKNTFWIGTWNGVYKFDGKEFYHFPMPYPEIETIINKDTKDWITEIKEDSKGNIWFARDGYGICKYDGKSFTHFLKKDGLHSNNVTDIEINNQQNIWLGTRVAEKDNSKPKNRFGKGGVNVLINKTILSFPEIKGFNNDDVYQIYKDKSGYMWISTIRNGVYRYDGEDFKNYDVPISIMSMMEDHKGNLWLGGAGGLYKIKKTGEVINVTKNGPWK